MKKTRKRTIASRSKTLLLAMGGSLVLASGLSACQTRRYNSVTKTGPSEGEAGVYSACMGMQGNGVLFSSHIGTLIALFENSIDPKVIVGGSSGSIVGSIGRALMNNKSIRDTKVMYRTSNNIYGELTTPQKAALILAAAEDAMNGFLFLPGVDNATDGQYLSSLIGFVKNLKANQLPDQAHYKILNIESTVGSAVLISAFFQLYDFEFILTKAQTMWRQGKDPDYLQEFQERKLWMRTEFKKYTHAQEWSLAQIIGLLIDPSLAKAQGDERRRETLRKFKVLQSEDRDFVKEPSTEEDLKNHDQMMREWLRGKLFFAANSLGNLLNTLVKGTADIFQTNKDDPNYKTFSNRIFNGEFLLPDPDLVMQAYQGLVPNPQNPSEPIFFPVPKGMIIHSTFRRGNVREKDTTKSFLGIGKKDVPLKYPVMGFDGRQGFENLYQGYIIGESLDGPERGAENPILKQMLERRNNAWSDFIKSNRNWRRNINEVTASNYARAPFLLYDRGSLLGARTSLKDNKVSNFPEMSQVPLPRNNDLKVGEMEAYLDPDHILIFNQGTKAEIGDFRNRGLNFGIQASAGEPGAFRRYAMKWTDNDVRLNSLGEESAIKLERDQQAPAGFEKAQVIPFGGWGENVPLSSIVHLKECQNAQFFVSSALDAPGNDFQAGALVAVVAGEYVDDNKSPSKLQAIKERLKEIFKLPAGQAKQPQTAGQAATETEARALTLAQAQGHFQRLTAAAKFSESLEKKWIRNGIDFNNPCNNQNNAGCPTKQMREVSDAIVPFAFGETRLNLAIASYQVTMSFIANTFNKEAEPEATILAGLGKFNAFGQDIHNENVTKIATWATNDGFFSRLTATKPPSVIKDYMDAVRNGTDVKLVK